MAMTLLIHPHLGVLLGALMLLLACAPDEATAQDRKPIHYISVSGSSTDNTCFYRIEEQDNQDLFRITPRGALIFTSSADFPVEATIEPDAEGNTGVAGDENTFKITEQGVTPIAVRRAMGRSTEHDIRIQCCTNKGFWGGCKWTPAEPMPPDEMQQMGHALPSAVLPPRFQQAVPSPHGPNAPSVLWDSIPEDVVPRLPVGTGGPVMKVDEDA